jgi:hypothetical protein
VRPSIPYIPEFENFELREEALVRDLLKRAAFNMNIVEDKVLD